MHNISRFCLPALFLFFFYSSNAQEYSREQADSLKQSFWKANNDSLRFSICRNIYSYYEEVNRDSALHYAELELQLSQKAGKKLAQVISLDNKAYQLTGLGRYAQSLQCLLQAFQIAEDKNNDKEKSWPLFTSSSFNGNNRLLMLAYTHHIFALLMWQTENSQQEIFHFKEARRISKEIGHTIRQMMADMNLGRSYLGVNKLDSAIFYENEAESLAFKSGFKKYLGTVYYILGRIYLAKGDTILAKENYYKAVQISIEQNNLVTLSNACYFALAKLYLDEGEKDSSLYFSKKNLELFQTLGSSTGSSVNLGTLYENLYRSYQLQSNRDSVFKYQGLALAANDSLYKIRIKNLADFQSVGFNEQLRLQNIEKEKAAYQSKVRMYALLIGIVVFLIIAIILSRNNRRKQRANELLKKQKQEIDEQRKRAEIEAALERVRAKTMAMQKPAEFVDVINVVGEQFIHLGFDFNWVNFSATGHDVSNGIDIWNFFVVPGVYQGANRITIPVFDHPVFTKAAESLTDFYTTGKEFSIVLLDKKDKDSFLDHLFTTTAYKDLPDDLKMAQYNGDVYQTSNVVLKDTWLSVGKYDAKLFTDEQNDILKRLANAFGQAYTRFLDLQKAEAQARESQIELGLERVRARAMAMQTSEELNALIGIVFTELTKLDLVLTRCVIIIYDAETKGAQWWMANSEAPSAPMNFFVKYANLPFFNTYIQGWEERDLKWQYILEGENKIVTDKFLFNETELKTLPGFVIEGMKAPHKVYLNASFNNFGNLTLATLEPLSEEHFNILLRFAKVFDLTYTRFNDLKQAEAQARESQIQLALERVRARTMAMQKSDELQETSLILFQQLKELGEPAEQLSIGIMNEAENVVEISATLDGKKFQQTFRHNGDEPFVMNKIMKAWKSQQKSLIIEQSTEELEAYNKFRNELTGSEKFPTKLSPGERRIVYVAFFSKGMLGLSTTKPRPKESLELLERFASVFDLTYTRFNDLKQAEAQAREAQIETALEKVRSRSMAMHKSDELKEVIRMVLEQFVHLKINAQHAGFYIDYKAHDDMHIWLADPNLEPFFAVLPYFDTPTWNSFIEAKAKGITLHTDLLDFEEKNKFYNSLFQLFTVPEEAKQFYLQCKGLAVSTVLLDNVGLYIENFSAIPYTDEENKILLRFGKVFQQTYTRFLDLQKAEAQAREAQIETALERVRSKTMAMHKSSDLVDVIKTLGDQFQLLGFKIHSANFNTSYRQKDWNLWLYNPGTPVYPEQVHVPYFDHPFFNRTLESIANGSDFNAFVFTKEEKDGFLDHLYSNTIARSAPEERRKFTYAAPGFAWSTVYLKNTALTIANYDAEPYTEEQNAIIRRFGNSFEQAYTRFLDLQKAEAQAREANIEAGLERVRSRAMAMQNSEELAALIGTVFTELTRLDLALTRCTIWIFDAATNGASWWMANSEDAQNPIHCSLPYNTHEPYLAFLEQWQKRANKFQYELSGTIKKDWDDFLFSQTGLSRLPAAVIAGMKAPENVFLTASFNNFGAMNATALEPLSKEDVDILLRFAKVFDLTYTRFNDLKQAEAQARESQIQLALERVRARTMAMQHSNELSETTAILFKQMHELGNTPERLNIGIIKEDKGIVETWATEQGGHQINNSFSARLDEPTTIAKLYEGWKTKKASMIVDLSGNELKQWIHYLKDELKMPVKDELLQNRRVQSVAYFKEGFILLTTPEPLPAETISLLERFAEVFNLTYTRFLDLQKAETQAREATIEAALERVRSRTMAMHKSSELIDAAELLFDQVKQLGVESQGVAFAICDKNSNLVQKYTSIGVFSHPCNIEPGEERMYEAWKNQSGLYEEVYEGEKQKKYYEEFMKIPSFRQGLQKIIDSGFPIPTWQKNHAVTFKYGYLLFITTKPFEETGIFLRFGKVFEQTYTRFLDLQKAEAATKEAVKQAALDRIRADIASMRTVKDLDRITPLIWNELTILGVPFIRCGVFIMDDEEQQIHTFLSTPDGKGIAAFHLPYNTPGNISHVISHWQKKEIYTDHWDEKAFKEFANSLVKQGAMKSSKQYLSTMPAGGFNLHFVPFQQGMLYVGNLTPLGEEEINLLQSLADAFSTAYARYEDFNKLEAAKKQVDKTLVELKQTQQQLVQSEKMASLGELTAGIAHEIQNPLNFINNFSEVNKELIEEMKEEISKGNFDEVKLIANDISDNETKINHHGKRADGIVKSMLQHSRKTTGQKELVDINALVDEYVRLSYHGLRAKDKSFNAIIETHFDQNVGRINVVGQDMGRVLLNLFNNAFYAVNEKKKNNIDGYEPTVQIVTTKLKNEVIIKVKDNGIGIPEKVLDKIYQPFFTTKPTGEGTGLGLSLSYDIITKGHNGEMKVETKENEGSEFIIRLPVI